MSKIAGDAPEARPAATRFGSAGGHLDLEGGLPGCPYLRSRDGGWSSAYASKDLRCWAVHPVVQPALQKQRQLCVVAAHASCALYAAALAADAPPEPDQDGPALWPDVSPLPVALEGVNARSRGGVGGPRTGGQALLVGLMAVALLVLVVARANPLAGPAASPSPAASGDVASAPVGASAAASSTPAPTVAATPPPATPTPAPTRTAPPTASPRTYTVRSGDTIAGIAAKYHSTVKAIVAANNIVDPRTIHPGQVLIIP